jgi:hypothetical protein
VEVRVGVGVTVAVGVAVGVSVEVGVKDGCGVKVEVRVGAGVEVEAVETALHASAASRSKISVQKNPTGTILRALSRSQDR